MGKILENVKGIFSRKQPNESRDQWASSSSQAGPSRSVSSWREDEPPAYSSLNPASSPAQPSGPKSAPAPAPVPVHLQKYSNDQDPFAFLTYFDTVFVIDDSGSMAGRPWREVADVLRKITPICTSHDSDGIDLYFLNYKSKNAAPAGKAAGGFYNIDTPEEITEIFNTVKPSGLTPMGMTLRSILKPYIGSLPSPQDGRDVADVKPVNIIAITDGDPSDEPDQVIAKYAKDLDNLDAPPHQVGIQFFQVGNLPEAKAALQRLDDLVGPAKGVRDMVDTVSWDANPFNRTGILSADTILKVVLGAVMRRLDKIPAVKT